MVPMLHIPLLGRVLRRLIDISAERHALARLSDDALADIGVSREDADAEARRLPWDIPECRRFDDDRSMSGGHLQPPAFQRSGHFARADCGAKCPSGPTETDGPHPSRIIGPQSC
ncbi:MAG: DUF1127 domain-containing protein [Pseudomonadota bacterium]